MKRKEIGFYPHSSFRFQTLLQFYNFVILIFKNELIIGKVKEIFTRSKNTEVQLVVPASNSLSGPGQVISPQVTYYGDFKLRGI